MVAGAATCVFRPTAAAPPANAVIAIESAFPARGLTVQDGIARNRAVNTAFLFYYLVMPFHNRKYRAFNQFLAG